MIYSQGDIIRYHSLSPSYSIAMARMHGSFHYTYDFFDDLKISFMRGQEPFTYPPWEYIINKIL